MLTKILARDSERHGQPGKLVLDAMKISLEKII
jgi:hypothetical protein